MTEQGIIETADGRHAVNINTGSPLYGWVLRRECDAWTRFRFATDEEMQAAEAARHSSSRKLRPIHDPAPAGLSPATLPKPAAITLPLAAPIQPGSAEAAAYIKAKLEEIAREAQALEIVPTMYQQHYAPAQRHYNTVVETRKFRKEGEA